VARPVHLPPAYVSIRQHMSAACSISRDLQEVARPVHLPPVVSVRQNTSAYVRIRQHISRSAGSGSAVHLPAYVSIRQHTSAYVSIRQHISRCTSIAMAMERELGTTMSRW
jgi:hypothetical protein